MEGAALGEGTRYRPSLGQHILGRMDRSVSEEVASGSQGRQPVIEERSGSDVILILGLRLGVRQTRQAK